MNAQFYDDQESLSHMALCGNIFASLADYKKRLMADAEKLGHPLVRSMYLHFHQDPVSYTLTRQFLLGPSLLVAPVMDPGTSSVKVYLPALPEGRKWLSVYGMTAVTVTAYPTWTEHPAPLGKPAVFVDEAAKDDKALQPFFKLIQKIFS